MTSPNPIPPQGGQFGLVVFVDIVGFSKLASDKQSRMVAGMKTKAVDPVLRKLRKRKRPIILPTGDGLAACFPMCTDVAQDELFRLHLVFLASLIHWAENPGPGEDAVLMRIGLHFGPITLIRDFNDQLNMIGDTVNMAARAMNAADKGQILIHQGYVSQFLGTDDHLSIQTRLPYQENGEDVELTLKTGQDVGVNVKHGVFITVRPGQLLVNNQPFQKHKGLHLPASTWHLVISMTAKGKPIEGKDPAAPQEGKSFGQRLVEARTIAFIQLTGYRMIEKWENAPPQLSEHLEKLYVAMPHGDFSRCLEGNEAQLRVEDLDHYINRWKIWLAKWQKEHVGCDVRLKLFKHPPYFGASFIDWEQPGGVIHVSPYIWGIPATACPGYDLEWGGCHKSPTYQSYIDGLTELMGSKDSCEKL